MKNYRKYHKLHEKYDLSQELGAFADLSFRPARINNVSKICFVLKKVEKKRKGKMGKYNFRKKNVTRGIPLLAKDRRKLGEKVKRE